MNKKPLLQRKLWALKRIYVSKTERLLTKPWIVKDYQVQYIDEPMEYLRFQSRRAARNAAAKFRTLLYLTPSQIKVIRVVETIREI